MLSPFSCFNSDLSLSMPNIANCSDIVNTELFIEFPAFYGIREEILLVLFPFFI